ADIALLSQFGIYTAGTPSAAVAGFTLPTRQIIPNTATNGINSLLGYFRGTATTTDRSADKYDSIYPTTLTPSYPEQGGNLTVRAQGNLTGAALPAPSAVNSPNNTPLFGGSEIDMFWLWTQYIPSGLLKTNGTWFINFGTYYQAYTGGSFNLP